MSQFTEHHTIELGVNVDHIATLRQARGTTYPDPVQAAEIARKAGAEIITVHLREDRRHIQDADVFAIREQVNLALNLEMAATDEMKAIAMQVKPEEVCLVPEKRQEITTEGGLDVLGDVDRLSDYVAELRDANIGVSMFVDPNPDQIDACKVIRANIVELHTGRYAEAADEAEQAEELAHIESAAELAQQLGLQVNAGHGLHYQNTQAIAAIPYLKCLNIGHSIVARATMSGFYEAVFTMKQIMVNARLEYEKQFEK